MADDAAVQILNGDVEILSMDFAKAYTSLVPLVVEAFVLIDCGKVEAGRIALSRARKTIEFASLFLVVAKEPQNFDGTRSELFR